jgi:two-component sensor histidine kinase
LEKINFIGFRLIRKKVLAMETSNVEPQINERDATRQPETSDRNLAELTGQLKASDRNLVYRTHQLETSDRNLAERTEQLRVSDRNLASSILRLETSDHHLAELSEELSGKTVLLQEVHHRVKNNLAVIGALLEMQADNSNDDGVAAALREGGQRVMSMALIHEELSDSEYLGKVNFKHYLEGLTKKLHTAYAVEADLVSVSVSAEDIDLRMRQVVPCALIVNELLSNALKYAYPRGQRGEIGIQFARLASGTLSLSCQDNGVGIPESFDWKNASSLGLRIIRILTKQLHGELRLDRSGGTKFELNLPETRSQLADSASA